MTPAELAVAYALPWTLWQRLDGCKPLAVEQVLEQAFARAAQDLRCS
jgi:hypothetical protein